MEVFDQVVIEIMTPNKESEIDKPVANDAKKDGGSERTNQDKSKSISSAENIGAHDLSVPDEKSTENPSKKQKL